MKTKRIIEFIGIILFLWQGNSVIAQRTDSTTIFRFSAKAAVDYALQNTVQVKNALLDIEYQKQSNKEVTAMALPQLSGNINVTVYLSIPTTLIPAEFFNGPPGTFIPVKFGPRTTDSNAATFHQLFFTDQELN